jgi:hypothetical protein
MNLQPEGYHRNPYKSRPIIVLHTATPRKNIEGLEAHSSSGTVLAYTSNVIDENRTNAGPRARRINRYT